MSQGVHSIGRRLHMYLRSTYTVQLCTFRTYVSAGIVRECKAHTLRLCSPVRGGLSAHCTYPRAYSGRKACS